MTITTAVHDRQLAEHGGSQGIRDAGGIESALTRPVNLAKSLAIGHYPNPNPSQSTDLTPPFCPPLRRDSRR